MAKDILSDLLAQKAALEKQIAGFQREQRGAAIAKIKALMAEYGLTLADVGSASSYASANTNAAKPMVAGNKKAKVAGSKVAAKYRNSATGDTWSGRGLKPKWMTAALAAGASISDFAL